MENKRIGTTQANATRHTSHNAIEVMKPFVKFGFRALGLLATTLIYIVKHIPKVESRVKNQESGVINIKS